MTSGWPLSDSETFALAWVGAMFAYCFIRDGVRWWQARPLVGRRGAKPLY